MTWLVNLWWRLVWVMKHRGGYVDLGRDIAIAGTVRSVEASSDGDLVFNLEPDAADDWAITTFGGRRTSENPAYPATLHCEVVPWDRGRFTAPAVGARLRVSGRWGYDGVHGGHGMFIDALRCLFGATPVLDGWCEIHPVSKIEVLS